MIGFKKQMVRLIVAISLLSQFTACNLTYKVRNQHNNIAEDLNFPCGKVTMELIGKGNSIFVFKQKFDLDNKVIVFKDSLIVLYNDIQINVDHNLKYGKKNKRGIEIKENKNWEVSFKLESGVFEGDTIIVKAPGYLRCNDESISLEPMVYSFSNNIRIYGVNDF